MFTWFLCKMQLFLNGLINFTWVSYVVDFIDNTIVIYDPSMVSGQCGQLEKLHLDICSQLKSALSECATELFEGWDFNWDCLEPVFHFDVFCMPARCYNVMNYLSSAYSYIYWWLIPNWRGNSTTSPCVYRHLTGFHTIHFCKHFDGSRIRHDKVSVISFKLPSCSLFTSSIVFLAIYACNWPWFQIQTGDIVPFYVYDLMHLRGNSGVRPRQFIETIDDDWEIMSCWFH